MQFAQITAHREAQAAADRTPSLGVCCRRAAGERLPQPVRLIVPRIEPFASGLRQEIDRLAGGRCRTGVGKPGRFFRCRAAAGKDQREAEAERQAVSADVADTVPVVDSLPQREHRYRSARRIIGAATRLPAGSLLRAENRRILQRAAVG
ncbi:MAG: hypothetical protein AW07_00595 [Candidatus Accumulibacter sp. SK-11]|nr:MAG: hypothetical protein AW07_00595 [Candidatus Accumulibacter sp. SK-11]